MTKSYKVSLINKEKKLKRFIINGAKGQQPMTNVVEPDSSSTNVYIVDNNTVNKVTDDVSVIIDETSATVEQNVRSEEKQSTNEEQITIRSVDRPDPIIGSQL